MSRGWVAVAASLLLGGCLVTGTADFEAVDRPTYLAALRPTEPVVRVPAVPENCPNSDVPGIRFEALISDEDTEQDLFWTLFVNGQQVSLGELRRRSAPAVQSRIDGPCLPLDEIQRTGARCNRVALHVSSDIIIAQRRPATDQLSVDSATLFWLVLNSPLNDPYVAASDCAPPLAIDGGVSP